MNTWWWTSQLMADGHVFNSSEWRCSDCRIRVYELLLDRPRCESPNNDDEFVFVGGPLDGDWRRASSMTLEIPMPYGPPTALLGSEERAGYEIVTYERSRMKTKGMVRYEFRG
jgi:hypothetical protein